MAKRRPHETIETLADPKQSAALAEGTHGDPFAYLGLHKLAHGRRVVRVFRPGAECAELLPGDAEPLPMAPAGGDLFVAALDRDPGAYRLRFGAAGTAWEEHDPYRFGPVLGALDEHFIGEGSHLNLWQVLGAHLMTHQGVAGVHFAVWAPSAQRVSVVGDFNHWNGRRHPLRARGVTGVWEIFLPEVTAGAHYKYEIRGADGVVQPLKADPVGFGAEHPPSTASIVRDLHGREWHDGDWLGHRGEAGRRDRPVAIYEAHLGSWRRADDGPGSNGRPLSYHELADRLVPYVRDLGFTHIEMLPITEFPFDGSWGYQPIGLYAPTIRHGTPDEFRDFVEACHAAGLGLILDWVPGHFPTDPHGLGRFDGTPLYEYADPREGFHQDWNTLIYNYGRREVQNYLIANALYWVKEHHLDGLRVDAVASMLYRDYSRRAGEWVPNIHGGRENLEAIAFLRRMNEVVYGECPGVMTLAEESTSFPAVSHPTHAGGLGFGYKWNMGWMNDTLDYMRRDPVHRRFHHHQITFGLHYAFTENFVLPLSHDEVVHGKGSLLNKMPGDEAEKFANLRAYYAFMWGHPGKKLLFMGQEFAQAREWSHQRSLDWHLLEDARHGTFHGGMQTLVRDLNRLYRACPALHQLDCEHHGFEWIEANAAEESIFAWLRYGREGAKPVLVACNFTPVERRRRFGVPAAGRWAERINSDARAYGGEGRGNLGGVTSQPVGSHGRADSIEIVVPPLATLIFELEG
ncbi:MAG: 1,4-alpha-glucan branching protein GlgB [Bacteroidota bacterium]|nr:1,4-alpha-glucan branching protein GlgB [Kiloniellaceae bacterium]